MWCIVAIYLWTPCDNFISKPYDTKQQCQQAISELNLERQPQAYLCVKDRGVMMTKYELIESTYQSAKKRNKS